MTEPGQRSQTTPASQRARAPRSCPERGDPLSAEARALVEHAARLPAGLELLLRSPLECAAVLLGAPPRIIERVRALLEDPAARAEAHETFARAAARAVPRAEPARPAPPRDPEALLLAARRRDDGLAVLLSASAECAAIAFAVHPDVVHAARDLAKRRGLVPDRLPDP